MHKKVVSLTRSNLLRGTFRGLRLHRLYNAWLERFPRTRSLPGSGVVYRARRTESVSLALEMLEGGDCYDASLLPEGFVTFADLGCNVGYFACWLAHYARSRPIMGLLVDANAAVLTDARWHVKTNRLQDVHILQGVVGVAARDGQADFYIYDADTCSTAQWVDLHNSHLNWFRKITVPTLQFGDEWRQRFGNVRCHVLKIDIEGSELMFLQSETAFLRLVDVIFVEWHKYLVTFDQLRGELATQGFKLEKIIDEMGYNGTACFKRA